VRLYLLAAVALLAASSPGSFALPDARLTPGAVGPNDTTPVSAAQACARGYARAARHPYDPEWRRYRTAIFREYGIPHDQWHNFTVEHLEPIELAGRPFGVINGRDGRPTWDLRNVWPEPKSQAPQKDAVENALHSAVCDRGGFHGIHLTLADAQRAIARDWTHTPVGLPPIEDRSGE
jgi:hypothetical protein